MKQELEITRELKRVRELLEEQRLNGWDDTLMYGAQQALIWVLEQGASPSELEKAIQKAAFRIANGNDPATVQDPSRRYKDELLRNRNILARNVS